MSSTGQPIIVFPLTSSPYQIPEDSRQDPSLVLPNLDSQYGFIILPMRFIYSSSIIKHHEDNEKLLNKKINEGLVTTEVNNNLGQGQRNSHCEEYREGRHS